MNIFDLPDMSATDQIAAIERGLPSTSLSEIADELHLPKQRIVAGLRLAPRTISKRERTRALFTLEESERLLRVLKLLRIARTVFSTNDAAAVWFTSPDRSLGMRTPLDMLDTDVGAAKVENLARAMAHGVPL